MYCVYQIPLSRKAYVYRKGPAVLMLGFEIKTTFDY